MALIPILCQPLVYKVNVIIFFHLFQSNVYIFRILLDNRIPYAYDYGILKIIYILYPNSIRLFYYTFYSPLYEPEAFHLLTFLILYSFHY